MHIYMHVYRSLSISLSLSSTPVLFHSDCCVSIRTYFSSQLYSLSISHILSLFFLIHKYHTHFLSILTNTLNFAPAHKKHKPEQTYFNHTHTHIHTHIYIYTYVYIQLHTLTNTHTHTQTNTHTQTHTHTDTHINTHTYNTHTYTHTHRNTHTHTLTHTHRLFAAEIDVTFALFKTRLSSSCACHE
jgi:hypothetical protein